MQPVTTTKPLWTTFDKWMRERLAMREMTQKELAERTGYSTQFINDLVSGRRLPSPDAIRKVHAELFGINVNELYVICGFCPPIIARMSQSEFRRLVQFIEQRIRELARMEDSA